MKNLVRILVLLLFWVSCFGVLGQAPAQALTLPTSTLSAAPIFSLVNAADAKMATEFGQKIDLNNSDIRDFRDLRGFYPNLASKIIKNAPYESVEDVLTVSGLSGGQKERLQANLDKFTVTEPAKEYIEGGDRINPGVY